MIENESRRFVLIAALIAAVMLVAMALMIIYWPGDDHVTIEGSVNTTLLYISTVTIDGQKSVSYATGVFLQDGTYLRLVGKQELTPGVTYRFTIVPDSYGEDWDEVVKLEVR